MGLFGALIVRPTMGADHVYNRADSQFTPSEDFLALLSEIDPYQHQAVESNKVFNMNNYRARYWMINGRGFPDSIADNYATWLPSQPYGALARIYPYDACQSPLPCSGTLYQRGHRGISFPSARQQRPADRPGWISARRRRPGPIHGEVLVQHRSRADLGCDLQVARR